MQGNYLYKFTDEEAALVAKYTRALLQTYNFISELHGLEGQLVPAPDGSGFIRPNLPGPDPSKGVNDGKQ